jgi:DNA-binding response OmpR family regulator
MPNMDSTSQATGLRIFIVENHADTLKYLRKYLQRMGHSVTTARTFSESLTTIAKCEVDVLISDIGLPDGNGWDLLTSIPDPKPRYAIAMSGFGMNSDRARSAAAGYRHHLIKPFPPEELEGFLAEAAREKS